MSNSLSFISLGCIPDTLEALDQKIWKYRGDRTPNPNIGCIVVAHPFFFSEDQWIPVPKDWSPSIVQGKVYESNSAEGFRLFQQVQERLQGSGAFYLEPRVGENQSISFRVLVTEAYNRRCAEKTFSFAALDPSGQYSIQNGFLISYAF